MVTKVRTAVTTAVTVNSPGQGGDDGRVNSPSCNCSSATATDRCPICTKSLTSEQQNFDFVVYICHLGDARS